MDLNRVTKTFSPSPPILIKRLNPPAEDDLIKQPTFKYARLDRALLHCTPSVRAIVDQIPLVGGYKNALLDIKVKRLEANEYPCLPGFHLDCTMNPDHPTKPETHHIYVFGCGSRTRFVVSPVTIPIENNRLVRVDESIEEQEPDIFEVEESSLYRYTRKNLHAPSRTEREGWRILIRLTETDLVPPKSIKI